MPKRQNHRRAAKTLRALVDPAGDSDLPDITSRFAMLLVVQGAEMDLGRQVLCDRPITLGRDDDTELPLHDGSISRRHCRVERTDDGRYVVVDLGSTNGTRLNGARVREPAALAEGDKIFVGSSIVKFGWADELDARYHARLETMAATDALTGLLSNRKFDAAFAQGVLDARETGTPLAVLVMDMDGLKQINDAHGHQMGGFTLAEVATVLRERLEGRGEVCRFGGDEFVAFLPGLDKAAAAALAETIRTAIEQHPFERQGVHVSPTVSIGVAALPDDGTNAEVLFTAADQALYRAKAAGKNRVSL
jgi:diguanylate cyclase (GGDEF)-like protein